MTIADKLITIADNTPAVAEAVNGARTTQNGTTFHIEDIADAPIKIQTEPGTEVKVCAKNLFNVQDFIDYANSVSKGNANDTYLDEPCFSFSNFRNADGSVVMPLNGTANTRYTLSCECSFSYRNNATYNSMAFGYVRYSDGTSESMTKSMSRDSFTSVTFTTNANKTVVGIGINKFSSDCTIYIKNMQIEVGTSATDYEDYAAQTYTADANGKVEGIEIIRPTMTIVADGEAEVTYFPVSADDIYEKYQRLVQAENELKEIL